MDRSQQWLRVVSAAEAPRSAADRSVALRMAVELGTSVVPASVGCSVTERAGAGYRTVSSANALSLALDHAQYAADEGPCLVAADDGTRQHVDVLADRTRFPAYADAAVARGVRSSLSVPVPDPGRAAALNFYASAPMAFEPARAVAVADLLARCVASLLPGGVPARDRVTGTIDLDSVRSRRIRMQSAVQALMAAEGLTRPAAFAKLARRSGAERRSVHSVAEDVLTGLDRTERS
jgi:hypothetical protein